MKKPLLYPAILSKTEKDYVYKIKESAKYFTGVQVDVMDGRFVKNKTIGVTKSVKRNRPKKLFFDIHLMVENPVDSILEWNTIGDRMLVHIESCGEASSVIQLCKGLKKKIGLVVNPKTPLSKVYPYLKDVDAIMVMSVVPGRSGKRFEERSLKKIKRLREIKKKNKLKYHILIDGGVNDKNLEKIHDAGVDTIAMGSFIWKQKDLGKIKRKLNSILTK